MRKFAYSRVIQFANIFEGFSRDTSHSSATATSVAVLFLLFFLPQKKNFLAYHEGNIKHIKIYSHVYE